MINKPDLPNNRQPVYDKHGCKRCDVGRKVIVNSVSGALKNQEGVVVEGPYWWVIHGVIRVPNESKKKCIKENGKKYVPHQWNSVPYWVVRMDANGFYHRLAENELTFLK